MTASGCSPRSERLPDLGSARSSSTESRPRSLSSAKRDQSRRREVLSHVWTSGSRGGRLICRSCCVPGTVARCHPIGGGSMTHYIGLNVSHRSGCVAKDNGDLCRRRFRSAAMAWPMSDGSGTNQACRDAARRRGCSRRPRDRSHDAEGLAQIMMRTGWYRSVHVKSLDAHRRALLGSIPNTLESIRGQAIGVKKTRRGGSRSVTLRRKARR
jgi:hypothetical protein